MAKASGVLRAAGNPRRPARSWPGARADRCSPPPPPAQAPHAADEMAIAKAAKGAAAKKKALTFVVDCRWARLGF